MTQQASPENRYLLKLRSLLANSIFAGGLIGFMVFVFFAGLFHFNVLKSFEDVTLEWRFKYFHFNAQPSDDIVILGIDNESINRIGRFPWSRDKYAKIVEALNFYGAKAIAFDLYFESQDRENPQADRLFAETIEKYNNVIIATISNANVGADYYSEKEFALLKKLSIKTKETLNGFNVSEFFSKSPEPALLKPYQAMFESVYSLGIVNAGQEGRTTVFEIPLIVEFKDLYFATLSLATYLNISANPSVSQLARGLLVEGKEIPADGKNQYLINWYRAEKTADNPYPYVSWRAGDIIRAWDLLENASREYNMTKAEIQKNFDEYYKYPDEKKCPPEIIDFVYQFPEGAIFYETSDFKDKIVFIGLTDQSGGTQDLIKTPLHNALPGVFLHANVLDNILKDDYIKSVPEPMMLIILFILCLSTGITVLGVKDPKYSLGIGFIYWLYFLIPLALFAFKNVYVDFIYIQSAIILTFGCSVAYQWIVVDRDKRAVKKVFSNYLAPQILNEVLNNPASVKLGGKKREITVLFSDIRGFTTISERNTPEGVVQFLNEYFDTMVDCIMKHEGAIDKFIGDAIMAFWGAPIEHENHPELAVRGALEMIEGLEKLKQKWVSEGKEVPEINIGVGLNTGEAIVGHVGSSSIKSYTVIGDTVNLASRLEGLNKKYAMHGDIHKSIIVSEYTYEKVKDKFDFECLGEETVKGKEKAVKIYKVLGIKEENFNDQ